MGKFIKFGGVGLALMLLLPMSARAEMEVLESTVPAIKVGSTLKDDTRLKLPKDSILRLLLKTPSGNNTQTLKGPYEGTVANYKEPFIPNGTDPEPPLAGTRDPALGKGDTRGKGQ